MFANIFIYVDVVDVANCITYICVLFEYKTLITVFLQLFDRPNKYVFFCLEKFSQYITLNKIGNHFLDKVVEQGKAGKTFTFVIDNIDWTVNVHEMRSDNQNKSIHAMATTVVFDHVPIDNKPDDKPKQSLL